jgi:diguanylate cyclase (GGDEF)-like protein
MDACLLRCCLVVHHGHIELPILHRASDEGIQPTVIFIDMDRFKAVNESVGMSAGDSILLTVARRLLP